MHRMRAGPRNRRGAALVEFAFVAPLFVLLVLGIFEFGRAMMVQTVLARATEKGARAGVLNGAQASDVADAVNQCLGAAGLPQVTPVVSPDPPSQATAGQHVTVTVNLPFSHVSLLPTPKWLGDVTLTATSVRRRETQ